MNHIKDIMNLGVLIDPVANTRLNTLNENEIKRIIDKTREERPLILTSDIIDIFLKISNFNIIKSHKKQLRISMQELTDMLNKRYDFIQSILIRKVELSNIVSINKCTNGKVSIIGMVKRKEPSSGNILIEIEDKTGSLKAIISNDIGDKIVLDDTIAISGSYNNKLLFGEKVLYPDVPLRNVSYSDSDTKIAFIINHDFSKDIHIEGDYFFVGNCDNVEKLKDTHPRTKIFILANQDRIDGNLQYISNPTYIEIDSVTFLLMFDNDPLLAIKKRFLNINKIDFLIDTVPDVIFTNKDVNTNYKSITILNDTCVLELKNRNVIKFNQETIE
ncbi:MAG: hypothetical protein KJ697_05215 [Nanoarchaeota archaeon]|nr:hypothetical protein [Nanoarchaeota archaeon]MBU4124397.1 hypothetical protein [Nanoarchaeota archaeon]